jgi:hypothetical protein
LGLAVSRIAAAAVGTTATFSSSSLRATWTAPSGIDHVRLSATGGGDTFVFDAKAGASTLDVTDLHSSTSYTISASLCADAACASPTPAGSSVTADVPAEVWGLQGSGDGVTKATKIVSDGNVRIHAIAYGKDAPAAQIGRTQLYYGPQPNPQGAKVEGLVVGLAKQVASPTVSTLDAFESLAGSSGLEKPTTGAKWITNVMTGQAVPLGGSLGDKIRLYFEAPGSDGKTRILYVDSADGYVGRDFNSRAGERCNSDPRRTSMSASGSSWPAMPPQPTTTQAVVAKRSLRSASPAIRATGDSPWPTFASLRSVSRRLTIGAGVAT